jgi:hypothetical protein
MILSVHAMVDRQPILSGVHAGRKLFGKLVSHAGAPTRDEVAFIDFADISVATGSFLRESVMAFRDYARSTLPSLYPVVANPSDAVIEELDFVLKHRKDVLWTCRIDSARQTSDCAILGELDASHREAFDLVASLGTASAPDLASRGDAGVGPTAWNNRLAFLAARGLLMERRTGKSKSFTPVLETV